MLTLLRRAVLFGSSRSHPQQLLTVFRAEHSLLVDIPTGWEPRTEQQPTGLIAHPAAQGRAVRILPDRTHSSFLRLSGQSTACW